MPNWNSNTVVIHAPLEAVKRYLVYKQGESYMFNMHLIFPAKFSAEDPTGELTWEYDWAVENTGSKWFPEVYIGG